MTNFRSLLLLAVATMLSTSSHVQAAEPDTFDTTKPFTHDPVMAVEDGIYYIYSTGHNISVMTSVDRHTWHVKRNGLLTEIPQWTHDSVPGFTNHIWAPDIIRWQGRWLLAYSCSTFGKNTSAIGLLSASSLALADWRDEGCLVASRTDRDNWNAIDPNFVEDSDGRLWLTWGSFWDGIQMAPLKAVDDGQGGQSLRLDDYPRTIARRYYNDAPQGLQNPTSAHAGVNAIEAPFIMKHGAYYYLFVSWDYCCRGMESNYRVVVGRSPNIAGPYIDRQGKPMYDGGGTPVIAGDKKTFEAIGHCAAYTLPTGQDIFIAHGYSIKDDGQPLLVERRIKWIDGWPSVE